MWNFATDQIVQKDSRRDYVSNDNRKIERIFMDGVIRYENRFLDNRLDLNAMFGASQEMRRDRSFSAQRYDWVDSSVDVINGATGESTTSGSHSEWAMRSFFGRINLGWADKYLLELNLRADASSRFTKIIAGDISRLFLQVGVWIRKHSWKVQRMVGCLEVTCILR